MTDLLGITKMVSKKPFMPLAIRQPLEYLYYYYPEIANVLYGEAVTNFIISRRFTAGFRATVNSDRPVVHFALLTKNLQAIDDADEGLGRVLVLHRNPVRRVEVVPFLLQQKQFNVIQRKAKPTYSML